MLNASVEPGVEPLAPVVATSQFGIVITLVVLLVIKPIRGVVVVSNTPCCSPCTVVEEAVSGVPVTVPPVALVAVNGVPVVWDSVD